MKVVRSSQLQMMILTKLMLMQKIMGWQEGNESIVCCCDPVLSVTNTKSRDRVPQASLRAAIEETKTFTTQNQRVTSLVLFGIVYGFVGKFCVSNRSLDLIQFFSPSFDKLTKQISLPNSYPFLTPIPFVFEAFTFHYVE